MSCGVYLAGQTISQINKILLLSGVTKAREKNKAGEEGGQRWQGRQLSGLPEKVVGLSEVSLLGSSQAIPVPHLANEAVRLATAGGSGQSQV